MMDRSRSKRSYYYDHHQDYDSDAPFSSRTRPRYNTYHHYPTSRHRSGGGCAGRMGKGADSSVMVTTSYRILCHDLKVGGVIGKGGSIIKAIRQHTGAWINVQELMPGDEERVIEITDTRRRDPDGRMPAFSPAQEALFLIHERIMESQESGGGGYGGYGDEEGDYGSRRGGGGGFGGRVVTRLVVSRMHVGSLLGKGGKIIEQMRMETKTQIRILPRDHTLPRCVSMGEEIVQIVGDANAVKKAISDISSRLRESQHRDRSHFPGRFHSDDRFDDGFIPPRRSSMEGGSHGSRFLSGPGNNRSSRSTMHESEIPPNGEHLQRFYDDLVFRMLCPSERVDRVVAESDGIVNLLENEIGVDVKVSNPVAGSDEQIITISSDEGPDDELFPAQEALLHIQTRIVDLVPDTDNVVTTRLLVPSSEIGCFGEGRASLSEMKQSLGVDIEILPRDKIPEFISGADELVQIVGEIKAAREALVEVTARLRSYLYRESSQSDVLPLSELVRGSIDNGPNEDEILDNPAPSREELRNEVPAATLNSVQTAATGQPPKDAGVTSSETSRHSENDRREDTASSRREDTPTGLNRIQVPLVMRSTLEVVIPDYAVPKLLFKSKHKLAQISELSGANVTFIEDTLEETEKVIRISGSREQAERAQSLLQGFLLSIQEDGP